MAAMQLRDIRAMGEALTSARELCQQSQYDKGVALYQSTLATLAQFIRRMTKMAERQPWLQMQIELENELSLIVDYVELTQAFKLPPGTGARHLHRQEQPHPSPSQAQRRSPPEAHVGPPGWEVYTPDQRRPVQSCNLLCLVVMLDVLTDWIAAQQRRAAVRS